MSLFQQTIASHPTKINRIKNLGFKFSGLSELHDTFGIFLIFKNIVNKILLLFSKSIKLILE